jgi:beta-lactamase regulating signal transducer with metallopeptidase domain/tetratricopeptide (TPR) repeat protein
MTLTELFSHPLWFQLGLTLVHFLWQGAAIAVLIWGAVYLYGLRHGSPRYNTYLMGLVLMIAAPIVTFMVLDQSYDVTAWKTRRSVINGPGDSDMQENGEPVVPEGTASPRLDSVPQQRRTVPAGLVSGKQRFYHSIPLILTVWFSGVLVLSMRLVLGYVQLSVWRFHAHTLPEDLLLRTQCLTRRFGYRRFMRIYQSDHVCEAMALGILRPVILLPASWITQMDPDMLEAIVAHELSHLRRYDLWINLVQRTMETLFFYHPAVWWLSHCLCREREYCCDQYAADGIVGRVAYVSALHQAGQLKLRTANAMALGFGAQSGTLLSRVRHVLGMQNSEIRGPHWLAGFVSLSLTALFLAPPILAWAQLGNDTPRGSRLEQATLVYQEEDWDMAARELGRYLSRDRKSISVWMMYAEAQLNRRPRQRSIVQQAMGAYREVLRLDKANEKAAKSLVEIYLAHGNPGEAESLANRFLKNHQSGDIQRLRAQAQIQLRQFNQAYDELKSMLETEPNNVSAYGMLGQLVERRPDDFNDDPGQWFDLAVSNNPDVPMAYILRADYFTRQDDPNAALRDLGVAAGLDLSDYKTRLSLAQAFMVLDKREEAEEQLDLVQEDHPEELALWHLKAQLADSNAAMLSVAKGSMNHLGVKVWDFYPTAAELFVRAKSYERAQEIVQKMQEKDYRPDLVAFIKGLIAYQKEEFSGAVILWQRSLQLGNKSETLRSLLALALGRTGDQPARQDQLQALASEHPDRPEFRLGLTNHIASDAGLEASNSLDQVAGLMEPPRYTRENPRGPNIWKGKDIAIPPAAVSYMRMNFVDDFVNRQYVNQAKQAWADVYVVYCSFRPASILGHRPRVIYKGNGWMHASTVESTVTSASGREVRCLVHRFQTTPPNYQETVVLSFYVANGIPTLDEDSFLKELGRRVNTERDYRRYVSLIQISSSTESNVRQAATDMLDKILDFLPGSVKR